MFLSILCALVLTGGPSPAQRLDAAMKSFNTASFETEYAALLQSIRALPATDARRTSFICEALQLGARGGASQKVEKDLRQLIEALEAKEPSYASLARYQVMLHATRTLERGRWTAELTTEVPQDLPCAQWDAGAARAALASDLSSRGMAFEATPAQRREADRLALEAFVELHRRATAAPTLTDADRAGLLDLSLVLCPAPSGAACPAPRDALRVALALRTKAFGASAPQTLQSALNVAVMQEVKGQRSEAEKTLRGIFPGLETASSTKVTREAAMGLFVLAQASGAPDAWDLGSWVVRELAKVPAEAYAPTLYFLRDGAALATRAKRMKNAVEWLTVAVDLGVAQGGAFEQASASDRLLLAQTLVAAGDLAAADREYVKVAAVMSRYAPTFVAEQVPDRWKEVADVEREHATVLDRLGRRDDAKLLRASAARHASPPMGP